MITSDLKLIRKLFRAKRIHVKDLYQVFTNKPKNLLAYFLSLRHVANINYVQNAGQKFSLTDESSPTCLFSSVGKIEVYSVAKLKSSRLGSFTMSVTIIYRHSVINKAPGELQF